MSEAYLVQIQELQMHAPRQIFRGQSVPEGPHQSPSLASWPCEAGRRHRPVSNWVDSERSHQPLFRFSPRFCSLRRGKIVEVWGTNGMSLFAWIFIHGLLSFNLVYLNQWDFLIIVQQHMPKVHLYSREMAQSIVSGSVLMRFKEDPLAYFS